LADKAHERRQAAVWENTLADEANEQRRHESAERATTSATKALAEDEYEDIVGQFFTRVDARGPAFEGICEVLLQAVKAMAAEELAAQESAKAADDCRRAAEELAAQESAKAADDRLCQEMAELRRWREALAAQESAKAADDRRRQEMTAAAEALAAQVLAEAASPASALAAQVLAKAVNESRCTLANDRPPQTVRQRARPRHCTGRRNCPRAPSSIDEALPSRPQATGGGTSPSALAVPILLARSSAGANSPPRSETPSLLLPTMASSSPSSQPSDVRTAVTMLLDGGGDLSLPLRKHARGRRHPRRVCRRHGPRAPNLLEPLLCGRRHRPRAPNECGG
jgi:hypothetical protein